MSLINEVLKSLSRKHPPQPTPWLNDRPIHESETHRRWLKWLMVIVILGVASVAGYHYGERLFKDQMAKLMREQLAKQHPDMKAMMAQHGAGSPLQGMMHSSKASATPATVELANPPLNPTANTALPPPPDLQGKALSQLAAKKGAGSAGMGHGGAAGAEAAKIGSGTPGAAAGAADSAKSVTVPLSALQTTTGASESSGDFSFTEIHNDLSALNLRLSDIADLARAGETGQAQTLFDQLPGNTNKQDKVILQAQILSFQNKNAEAVRLMEDFNAHNTLSADGVGMLAELYDLSGQYQRSQQMYQKLVGFWPDDAKWWLGLGIASMHNGQYSQAIIAFEKVVQFPNQITAEVNSYAQTQLRMLSTQHPTYY